MDDVVDLDEVLAVAGQDVLRGELVGLEAVDVALVQVERRAVAVRQPLGHGAAHPRRMRHPHGLGHPEALDLGRLAEQRHVVGGEGEQAVDALFELHLLRGNLHSDGLLIAYIPREKLLIQADTFAPRPGAPPLPSPSPYTANLLDNIKRLKLDVARIAHVHGGVDSFATVEQASR